MERGTGYFLLPTMFENGPQEILFAFYYSVVYLNISGNTILSGNE